MKHIQARTIRAAMALALGAGVLLALSTSPSATAQDRRGRDQGAGPRREDAAPRRDAPPARDSAPGREAPPPRVDPQRETPPVRDSAPGREAPPPRIEGPRETPPARDRAPARDSAPPRIERDRDRTPPASDPRPSRDQRDRSAYDRGRPGERANDDSTRIERRPPSREDRSGAGQESNGRVLDRPNSGQRSRDDRGDRGIFDRSPRTDTSRPGGSPDRSPRPNDHGRAGSRSPEDPVGIRVASPRPYRDTARDIFTRSAEGRRYDRGITLRPAVRVVTPTFGLYFPHGYCYYPYYSHSYVSVDVIVSPYHFYYGVYPPYVYRRYVYHRPPRVVYVEVPVYIGGTYYGYSDGGYYLDTGTWWRDSRDISPDLRRAIEDLEDAFRYSDINVLANLTEADTDIAVFTKGRYQYSLRPNDYLDMTRDFMVGADTIRFDVFRAKRRGYDVCTLSAKHTYRSRDGQTRVVYLSFVLERIGRYWTITQVDTAPDRL